MILREAIKGTRVVEYVKKPALHGITCDGCGQIFQMAQWNPNDRDLGELHGTFECGNVRDESGRGQGNMFSARVCSFACADKLMKGGWRDLDRYKIFANADAVLVRAELRLTTLVKYREQLEREWDALPLDEASEG